MKISYGTIPRPHLPVYTIQGDRESVYLCVNVVSFLKWHQLLFQAWRKYNEGKHLDVVDPAIMESSNHYELFRVIQIALLCVQQYPEDRPSMSSVVLMLSSKIELTIPKEPGFYSERNPEQNHSSSSKCDSESVNEISITRLTPR